MQGFADGPAVAFLLFGGRVLAIKQCGVVVGGFVDSATNGVDTLGGSRSVAANGRDSARPSQTPSMSLIAASMRVVSC